jgi:hypothetical protein
MDEQTQQVVCEKYLSRITLLDNYMNVERYSVTFITTENLEYTENFVKILKQMNQV